MSCENPQWLFLLIVPVLVAITAIRHRGAVVAAPIAPVTLRSRRGLVVLLAIPTLIPPALLAILVVLLAGPVRFEQSTGRVPKELTNIQFCLNVSNTMLARRIGMHCRYCAATNAMGRFARDREGDAFGLTLFGTMPIVWVPLSDDVSALYRAAQLCYPDHMPDLVSRYPDTAAGLRTCIDQLTSRSKGSGSRLIILLTDGEDPQLARHIHDLSELMIQEEITLHVLLFQNPGSARTLDDLARRTPEGGLFDCSSAQELAEVFRTIDEMKRIEYEASTPQKVPQTRPWLVAGGSLALVYFLSLFGMRYTPW